MIKKILLLLISLFILSCAANENKPLETDKTLITGELKNGFNYVVKENRSPKNRAFFYFITKAGSAMEEDSQQGIAHFVEHMAFNGSKNFSKNDVIEYLRSIGARFGGDTNAWTSLDQTVYVLSIPLTETSSIDTAFKIMNDYANGIAFNQDDINNERGIILEEWRTHLGANERIQEKQWPTLFKNSPFANRLPIGKPEIIKTANRDTFVAFYEKWYQSQFQSIVAVGDFKGSEIETKIKDTFSSLKKGYTSPLNYDYTIPNENIFQVDFDKELANPEISIIFRKKVATNAIKTLADFKKLLLSNLIHSMLNNRMLEATKQANSPLESLSSGDFAMASSEYFYMINASYKENRAIDAYKEMLRIIEQARQFGFTNYEMELAKKEVLKQLQKSVDESDRTESSSLIMAYTQAILSDSVITSTIEDLRLAKEIFKNITVNELRDSYINYLSGQMLTFLTAKEASPTIPTSSDLEKIILTIDFSNLSAYMVEEDKESIYDIPSTKGTITKTEKLANSITKWTLQNGIEIFIMPTEFKNNEILFKAQAKGGLNKVSDADFISASLATALVKESGLGKWDAVGLERKLSSSLVKVEPFFTDYSKGFMGTSPAGQLEELFQQLFLYTDGIRDDDTAYNRLKDNLIANLKDNAITPETAFAKAFNSTIYPSPSIRYQYPTAESYATFDKTKALTFFTNEFNKEKLSQMQYIFVGSIDEEVLKTLVENWLGSLPNAKALDTINIVEPPVPSITPVVVKAGFDNKANLLINYSFSRPFDINESAYWTALNELVQMRLVKSVREAVGATYSPRVKISREEESNRVQMNVFYSLDPSRVAEVIALTEKEVNSVLTANISDDEYTKTKTVIKEVDNSSSQENSYWLSMLSLIIDRKLDFSTINSKKASMDNIDASHMKPFLTNISKTTVKSTITLLPTVAVVPAKAIAPAVKK